MLASALDDNNPQILALEMIHNNKSTTKLNKQ